MCNTRVQRIVVDEQHTQEIHRRGIAAMNRRGQVTQTAGEGQDVDTEQ